LHSDRAYYVYLMASRTRVLYVGTTSDLLRRVFQHKNGAFAGFTRKYLVNRLVYFERTSNSRAAVARERQIKGWTREKKFRLVETTNLGWKISHPAGSEPVKQVLRYAQDDTAA
jgi:putative endonuclease